MKKILLTFLIVMLIPTGMEAQRRNGLISRRGNNKQIVLSIGPNYAFADPDCSKGFLGPVLNQNILSNRDVTIGFRDVFSNNLGYKANLSYDNFTGEDIISARNYSFVTSAFQINVQGEYSYKWGQRFRRATPNTLYGFIGLGVLYSVADLNYPSIVGTYKYEPKYLTPVIPLGFGYYYNFNRDFYVGAELKIVYTFSDYLDGFKPPSPQSKNNDIIEGFSITLGYKILDNFFRR